MGVNNPTSYLSGPQPFQAVIDLFDWLILDRNRLDLPGSDVADQVAEFLRRTDKRSNSGWRSRNK
jgi:hypothetical protein